MTTASTSTALEAPSWNLTKSRQNRAATLQSLHVGNTAPARHGAVASAHSVVHVRRLRSLNEISSGVTTISSYRRRAMDRRLMAETIGERDEDFLSELQSAGYTAHTIALAEIAPQIEIAWADGRVSTRERDVIFESAAQRGVPPDSVARLHLVGWLEHRPSDRFFRVSRVAIERMLRRLPIQIQAGVRRSLLQECVALADASGGILGWGSVSVDERHVIDSFAAGLAACAATQGRAT
jgi:hypothetical protein